MYTNPKSVSVLVLRGSSSAARSRFCLASSQALPRIHITEEPKHLCVVRKFALSLSQFLARPIIIQITQPKVSRLRKMCLARIRLKTSRSLYTGLG